MNNPSNRLPEALGGGTENNQLWSYVQSLSPETIAQLSRPASPEVFQVVERNIVGLLGALSSEHFDVTVTTSREDLGRLLASAMMSGYFIRSAEQRMTFEKSLTFADADSPE
ncbi:MAG TPA: DUF760 domain-containing protein [Thermosynechococcaceae cyanobacterium]